MRITVAQSAGFCYGVRRAVELAERAAREDAPCVMLGPIIHNRDVIARLAAQGIGVVERPVEVPEGSRAAEALELAGGMTTEADPFYVNLAEIVTDGQKLYFPTASEAEEMEAAGKAAEEGLVNINTASAEELCTLPGIGASRAADIVRYREKNGAFQTKEDIMKVSGIKQNAYDKLCDRITVQ